MKSMELENIIEIDKNNNFQKIKRTSKFNYKYIVIFLFFIIIICMIIFASSLFLRVKKFESNLSAFKNELKKIKNDVNECNNCNNFNDFDDLNDSKLNLNLPQSFIEIRRKSKQLMKMVNNSQIYKNATKCFIDNPDKELCFYKYLVPKKVVGKDLKLYGPKRDGGYVLLNDTENISIAYSIGIDHEISFDYALASKNISVYMYDHTISSLYNNNSRFHWKQIGISGISNKSNYTKTLKEMLKENAHLNKKNMILKIDVEYAEWEALLDTPTNILKKFKYITIEFHFKDEIEKYFKVLKKLYETHQVIYLICNNDHNYFSILGNNIICTFIEVSYVIREGHQFYSDDTQYPIPEIKFKNFEKPEHSFNLNIIKLFDYQNGK